MFDRFVSIHEASNQISLLSGNEEAFWKLSRPLMPCGSRVLTGLQEAHAEVAARAVDRPVYGAVGL